jgi:hypothetical protein
MSAAERVRATAGTVADPSAQPVVIKPKPEAKEQPQATQAPQKVVNANPKQFVGRWRVLNQDGSASSYFSLTETEALADHAPQSPGKWEMVGDEVHITYSNGSLCILRSQPGNYRIAFYAPGAKWGELPAVPAGEGKVEQISTEPAEEQPAKTLDAKQFVGRWRIIGDAGRVASVFTLTDSFTATKSHDRRATGKWEVVGNEARITWSDGWKDILRVEKDGVTKIAFGPKATWTDTPTNTQQAVR